MDIIIYLCTCDNTSYILPATIFLYKKFINPCPLIRILGFKKPKLPDWVNVEFISLGDKQESIELWSIYIYNYLKTVNDKFIYFGLDDFFPIDYLNNECYNYVINYMNVNNVGFCVVSQEPSSSSERNEVHSKIFESDNFFVYRRKKPCNYQLVLQPGIWNRNYLLKFLNIKSTPWMFELDNSRIANLDDGYFNISTSNFPINSSKCMFPFSGQSSLSGKWTGKISVLGLKSEYVEELIDKNLIDKTKIIIGAWDTYTNWSKEFNKKDLKILSNTECSRTWMDLYQIYYI